MKLLVSFLLLSISFVTFADIIVYDCHPSYTAESLRSFYEEGEGELVQDKDSYLFVDSGDIYELKAGLKDVPSKKLAVEEKDLDYKVTYILGYGRGPRKAGKTYKFTPGKNDYDGHLEVWSFGGFTGKRKLAEMLCLLTID